MGTVKNLLQKKGTIVHSVSPDSSVYDALEVLESKNLGALVVVEDQTLIGIFTERDYARKVVLKGRSSKDTLVRDIMTDRPIYVTPDNTIDDCMQIMTDKFIRHLPVLDNSKLVGVISIGDVVKYVIEEKNFIIENLEHYIVS
ncbi:CBS domain-containing protein [Segetibacter koreensis]|uniref:CBS domain-containing protein n=1 Tax=Segetibacter koreensis TaxID=398037 RepID=UPI00035EF1F6|nr:CBS domain-containing protein [Segetibacter koreensis]